jgi:hypothetical protein
MVRYQKTTGYIADAYSHLLLGRSENDLYDMEYTKSEIHKAKIFRDKYQNRSMFKSVVAKEMGVSTGLVERLQKIYSEYQEREMIACTGL